MEVVTVFIEAYQMMEIQQIFLQYYQQPIKPLMIEKKIKGDCQISDYVPREGSVKDYFLEYNAPSDCFLNF